MNREAQVEKQLGPDAAVAAGLALQAGALVREIRSAGFEVNNKPDRSVVTRADLEADQLIRTGLQASFPRDGLLSEETTGLHQGSSGRTWVVDPLDGTSGFVNGTGGYAVQIGLLDGNTPSLGVVYEPARDRLWVAGVGRGTWGFEADGTVMHGSVASSRGEGVPLRLVSSSRMPDPRRSSVASALGAEDLGVVSSVGVKVGLLVGGEAEVYVSDHPVSYWDSCAPLVILQEADGQASVAGFQPFTYDLAGNDWRHSGSFMASSSEGHEAAFNAVASALNW